MTAGLSQEVGISTGEMNGSLTKDHEDNGSRASRKKALMELIAQEMVTSLLGKDDDTNDGDEDEDATLMAFKMKLAKREAARRKSKRRSSTAKNSKQGRRDSASESTNPSTSHASYGSSTLADMYYAQMNGQVIPEAELKQYEVHDKDDDNDSFAGGCLDDLVYKSHRSSSSKASKSVSASSQSSNSASNASKMDIDEIRKYVLENIPQAVREQIPEEAWGEIFGGGASSKGSSSKKPRSKRSSSKSVGSKDSQDTPLQAIIVDTEVGPEMVDDDDDLSVLSEITGFTTAFPDGRRLEKRRASLSRLDPSDLEEPETPPLLCPEAPGECAWSVDNSQDFSILDEPTAPSREAIIKKVDFGHVTIRYYERILTDNPAVQSGPAIGIGWRYKRGKRYDMIEFEEGRGLPRTSAELVLSRPEREQILKEAGYSPKEIADMVRVILKAKNQRATTVNNLSAQGVEEAVESAKRRVGRLLGFGQKTGVL